jgi:hypothetical protein
MNVAERHASELQVHRWMVATEENTVLLKMSEPEMDVHGCHLVLVRREAFGRSISTSEHQPPRQDSK